MPGLSYDVVDVFTDRPYAGNPLAVVHGGADLTTGQMQAIAAEFGFSETAFALPVTAAGADYRVRIFTPAAELPFAGHPSVGAAWVLARDGVIAPGIRVQECAAGLLPVEVDAHGATVTGGTPSVGEDLDAGLLATAVGLEPDDVDGAAAPGTAGAGVVEDPATGSAAVALAVFLADRGLVDPDGEHTFTVAQGAEIGRPSTLHTWVRTRDGAAVETRVGGRVEAFCRGEITSLPAPTSAG